MEAADLFCQAKVFKFPHGGSWQFAEFCHLQDKSGFLFRELFLVFDPLQEFSIDRTSSLAEHASDKAVVPGRFNPVGERYAARFLVMVDDAALSA